MASVPRARAAAIERRSRLRSKGPIVVCASNFKSIAAVEVPDVRLTVIAGSNSSGKSSLLQAVLFITQSAGQRNAVINGDLVRLGAPKDVIRDGTSQLSITFSFGDLEPDGGRTPVAVEMTMVAAEQTLRGSEVRLLVDGIVTLRARAVTRASPAGLLLASNEVALRVDSPVQLGLPDETYLTVNGLQPVRLAYRADRDLYVEEFEHVLAEPSASLLLDDLLRASPRAAQKLPDELRRKLAAVRHGRVGIESLASAERHALFQLYFDRAAPGGWSSELIMAPTRLGRTATAFGSLGRRPHVEMPHWATVTHLISCNQRVQAFAESVMYLGPLRDDPRVAYPLGHTVMNLPVGEKGEFTAAYLEEHRDRRVVYSTPENRRVTEPLLAAVSRWCHHLGIADEVDVVSRGKLGHELKLGMHGQPRDPTAVGVGASQLLPVVVLVLGAERGSLVLLEQPELHLHPKVQSRLGDFFARAKPDIRLLIETHSEYLITRLRLRVAEGDVEREDLAVLFARQKVTEYPVDELGADESVESDPTVDSIVDREVATEFERLLLNTRGDFESWPEDFFDTLTNDSVALARAVSRQVARELASQPDVAG